MDVKMRMTPVWLSVVLALAVYALVFVGPFADQMWFVFLGGAVLLAAYGLWFGRPEVAKKGRKKGRPRRNELRFVPKDVVYGLVGGGVCYGLAVFGRYFFDNIMVYVEGGVTKSYALIVGWDPAVLGVVVVVGAVCEELFWRGYMQRMMSRRWGYSEGFWNVVIAYGVVHVFSFRLSLIAAALVLGLVWSLMFRWTRRVWPGAIAHVVSNVLLFIVLPLW
jgi:membrane protease YdiL (CAAX protease family)